MLTHNLNFESKNIDDRRIGVCIPDFLTDSAKEAVLNHLAITEMEKDYDLKMDVEAEEIRQWIRIKKREYISALLDSQLPIFSSGRVFTQQALAIDVKRVFSSGSLDKTATMVANNLLSEAYQKSLIDSSLFKNNFTAKDAKKVFSGFFEKNAGSASTSACENFGPGLGLSKSSSPKTFNPSHSRFFAYLKKKLEENDFEFPTWKLYRELEIPPYGLTNEIITLNLLCFVRSGDPSVEIRLRSGHKQAIGTSRITSFNVPEVQWRGRFEEDFDLLTRSTLVNWNDIVNLARLFAPEQDLKTATKPEDIIEQERRLLVSLQGILNKLPTITANLNALWSAFGKTFPYSECIKNVEEITDSRNYTEFQSILSDIYSGNQKSIENDAKTFGTLAKLSDQATIILGMRSYLEAARIPSDKDGLGSQRELLLKELDPESFVGDFTKIDKIREQYEAFKNKYAPRYQIHHRDYNSKLKKALEQLQATAPKIDSIQRLNEIGLNLPTIKGTYSTLERKFKPCTAKDPVSVDSSALCKECQTIFADNFDESEIKAFLGELDENVKQGMKGLSQMLTKQVLTLDKDQKLDTVMKYLEADDIDSFVIHFSKPISEYIRALLAKANIETINISVFEFIRRHSFVEEERIEEVAKAFRDELVKALEKAKKEKPGKRIRISLGE